MTWFEIVGVTVKTIEKFSLEFIEMYKIFQYHIVH